MPPGSSGGTPQDPVGFWRGRACDARSPAPSSWVSPPPAKRYLGLVFLHHLCGRCGVPSELRGEPFSDALADAEPLIARHEQERDPSCEDVLDRAGEVSLRGEVDLGPHVRQLAIESLAERAVGGDRRAE